MPLLLSSSIAACTYLNNISGQNRTEENREIRCFFAPSRRRLHLQSVYSCVVSCVLSSHLLSLEMFETFLNWHKFFPISRIPSLLAGVPSEDELSSPFFHISALVTYSSISFCLSIPVLSCGQTASKIIALYKTKF